MMTRQTHMPRAHERAAWAAIPLGMAQEIRARAAALHDDGGNPTLTATQYMAYTRSGDRAAFSTPYYARRHRLITAVLAACLDDAPFYLDTVTDGLWALCEESTWCISAHNLSGQPLPDVEAPALDLFAAQSGALLSWACYLLEDRLLPLVVQRVRSAVLERVLTPFRDRDDFWWMGLSGRALNNWTPWILANVLGCARVWGEDVHARAETILGRWLAYIPEDGGLDEGVSYWNMAGGSLLDCLEHLGAERYYGEAKIRNLAAFPLRMHIGAGYYANFADCDAVPVLDGERVYTFGRRTGNEPLMALGSQLCQQSPSAFPRDTPEFYRTLCRLFQPVSPLPPPAPPRFTTLPNLEIWIRREGGLFAAIKGGHNDESHNHNDIGSLIVYVDGQPAIVDAGNITYTGKTFDPATRYTIWNNRSENHNLPLIGPYEQCAGRTYHARDVSLTPDAARMDIAPAYPAETGVKQLTRMLRMESGSLLLSDTIRLDAPQPVRWVFLLREAPRITEGSVTAGPVRLAFPPKLAATFTALPVTDARMARSYPGTLYRLMLEAAPATEIDISFRIERSAP